MTRLRTAVIGVGYLGRFHAEKYAALPHVELVAVVDSDQARATQVAQTLNVEAASDYREILGRVDAVSIAVPTQHHHAIAKECLSGRIHVLLEKPITVTVEQAKELIEVAKENECVLQIGHLERFNPAVMALEEIIARPLFIESHRLALFNPRGTDVSVVLDLMIHDIDIILNLVGSPVHRVDANGVAVLSQGIDIANARLQFENGCVANVTASRVSQKKQRKMRLFQPDAYISIDFQDKRVNIHRKGTEQMYPGIPEITSEELAFDAGDALKSEISAFTKAVLEGIPPVVSGEDGRRALEVAIEISRQLVRNSLPTPD